MVSTWEGRVGGQEWFLKGSDIWKASLRKDRTEPGRIGEKHISVCTWSISVAYVLRTEWFGFVRSLVEVRTRSVQWDWNLRRLGMVSRLHVLQQANDQKLNYSTEITEVVFLGRNWECSGDYLYTIYFTRKNCKVAVTVNLHALIFHSTFLIHTILSFFYYLSMVFKTFSITSLFLKLN